MASLQGLHKSVNSITGKLGFRPDASFKPHLTLGRVRDNADDSDLESLQSLLNSPSSQPSFLATFRVSAISLMRSELTAGGSIYTRLAQVDFTDMP
jgi:2'-5' RNA ligase